MAIIPVNLDDETIKKIDFLVKKGVYKNRSEALLDQIKKGIESISLIPDLETDSELFQKLLKVLLNLPEPPQFLDGKKSLTELVSEGRKR